MPSPITRTQPEAARHTRCDLLGNFTKSEALQRLVAHISKNDTTKEEIVALLRSTLDCIAYGDTPVTKENEDVLPLIKFLTGNDESSWFKEDITRGAAHILFVLCIKLETTPPTPKALDSHEKKVAFITTQLKTTFPTGVENYQGTTSTQNINYLGTLPEKLKKNYAIKLPRKTLVFGGGDGLNKSYFDDITYTHENIVIAGQKNGKPTDKNGYVLNPKNGQTVNAVAAIATSTSGHTKIAEATPLLPRSASYGRFSASSRHTQDENACGQELASTPKSTTGNVTSFNPTYSPQVSGLSGVSTTETKKGQLNDNEMSLHMQAYLGYPTTKTGEQKFIPTSKNALVLVRNKVVVHGDATTAGTTINSAIEEAKKASNDKLVLIPYRTKNKDSVDRRVLIVVYKKQVYVIDPKKSDNSYTYHLNCSHQRIRLNWQNNDTDDSHYIIDIATQLANQFNEESVNTNYGFERFIRSSLTKPNSIKQLREDITKSRSMQPVQPYQSRSSALTVEPSSTAIFARLQRFTNPIPDSTNLSKQAQAVLADFDDDVKTQFKPLGELLGNFIAALTPTELLENENARLEQTKQFVTAPTQYLLTCINLAYQWDENDDARQKKAGEHLQSFLGFTPEIQQIYIERIRQIDLNDATLRNVDIASELENTLANCQALDAAYKKLSASAKNSIRDLLQNYQQNGLELTTSFVTEFGKLQGTTPETKTELNQNQQLISQLYNSNNPKYKLETLLALMKIMNSASPKELSKLSANEEELKSLLDKVQNLTEVLSPKISEINQQLPEAEKISEHEIPQMLLLALLEEKNIENSSSATPNPTGKLFGKTTNHLSHAIILSKEFRSKTDPSGRVVPESGQEYYSILIKPTIHNTTITANEKTTNNRTKKEAIREAGTQGSHKVVKLSGIEVSWPMNNPKEIEAKRVVTVSQDPDSIIEEANLTEGKKANLLANEFKAKIIKNPDGTVRTIFVKKTFTDKEKAALFAEGFKEKIIWDPKISTTRTIYVKEYLGKTLHSCQHKLTEPQKKAIARQLWEKFDPSYTDIKPANVLVDIKPSGEIIVNYIDYSSKGVHTVQTLACATSINQKLLEKQRILLTDREPFDRQNTILGLCYTLFLLLNSDRNRFELTKGLLHSSQEHTFQQWDGVLPDTIITANSISDQTLVTELNKAYRGELPLEELQTELAQKYPDISLTAKSTPAASTTAA